MQSDALTGISIYTYIIFTLYQGSGQVVLGSFNGSRILSHLLPKLSVFF